MSLVLGDYLGTKTTNSPQNLRIDARGVSQNSVENKGLREHVENYKKTIGEFDSPHPHHQEKPCGSTVYRAFCMSVFIEYYSFAYS